MKVIRIEEVFTKNLKDRVQGREEKRFEPMDETIVIDEKWRATKKFEKQILNFLFKNRESLGIEKVYEIEKYLVDGAIMLEDGRLVLLEMKFVLNWRNSCTARIEIQRFVEEKLYRAIGEGQKPVRGIVVFKDFGGDWNRDAVSRELKDGWYKFYEDEKPLREGANMLPVDNAQFTESGLNIEKW